MTVLDWRKGHWNGGPLRLHTPPTHRCHLCGRLAYCKDDRGRPCHKRCEERRIDYHDQDERNEVRAE